MKCCPHCETEYTAPQDAVACWLGCDPRVIWRLSRDEMAARIGCAPPVITNTLKSLGLKKPYVPNPR